MRTALVRITSGELLPFLHDVIIWGGIHTDRFVIYGCHSRHEDRFYQGILEYDKSNQIQGFETVEEVKHYWEETGDMTLVLEHDEYEEIEVE